MPLRPRFVFFLDLFDQFLAAEDGKAQLSRKFAQFLFLVRSNAAAVPFEPAHPAKEQRLRTTRLVIGRWRNDRRRYGDRRNGCLIARDRS